MLKVFEGHTGSVNAVAISTDGGKIVSGSDDHTVRVWSMETGQVCLLIESCRHHAADNFVSVFSAYLSVRSCSVLRTSLLVMLFGLWEVELVRGCRLYLDPDTASAKM